MKTLDDERAVIFSKIDMEATAYQNLKRKAKKTKFQSEKKSLMERAEKHRKQAIDIMIQASDDGIISL